MNNTKRYDPFTRWLHWAIFLLFIGLITSAELRGYIPKESAVRKSMMTFHKSLGIIVMAFVVFRIYWRLAGPSRVRFPHPFSWQHTAARGVHLALYIIMIVMPLSGYLMSAFGGRPILLFGLVPVPMLLSSNPAGADLAHSIHTALPPIIYFLLISHILAALWHRYVYRDEILQRML